MSSQAGSSTFILVTGGAGFIGSHLVERLLADGKAVVVIDDCSTGSLENLRAVSAHQRLRVIVSTVSGCDELPKLAARAEAIYHLAAAVGVELVMKSPVRAMQTNVRETEAILEAASTARTPVLLTSTSEVYGKSQQPAFSEEDDLLIGPPSFGRWSYACSKLMDEFLALAHAQERGLPVVIARLFNTVGPRQSGRHGMVLPRFIRAAKAVEPLRVFGDGRQTRCFCYVGGTEEISIRDLAELVIQTLGSKSRIEFVDYREAYGPGFEDMLRRRPRVEKLAATIGFRPPTSLPAIVALA